MSVQTIYAGPGKLFFNGIGLSPIGDNGELKYEITANRAHMDSAMFGRLGSQLAGVTGKVSLTPADNWGSMPTFFPPYLGVSVGATTGALVMGTRPHTGGNVAAKIWSPDGRLITIVRAAITKHPEIHLGVDKPLFGGIELTALADIALDVTGGVGTAGAFHAITATGATDPGGQFGMADFIRCGWTGVLGTAAGFGGGGGDLPMQTEEEWVISNEIKYDALTVQKQTVAMKLSSSSFMVKGRLTGPTWAQIEALVLTGRLNGSFFGYPGNGAAAMDLALTSQAGGKTITLKNADVVGEGFEFGGIKLGTGEVGFVNQMTFTAGAPQPQLLITG